MMLQVTLISTSDIQLIPALKYQVLLYLSLDFLMHMIYICIYC